jgi:mRNA interferase MazF
MKLVAAPGNVLLSTRATGLPKEAVASVSQLITIDRAFLTEFVARLPGDKLGQIEEGLCLVLDLS